MIPEIDVVIFWIMVATNLKLVSCLKSKIPNKVMGNLLSFLLFVGIFLFSFFYYYFFLTFWLAYNQPFNIYTYVSGFILANVVLYYFYKKKYLLGSFLSYNIIIFIAWLLSTRTR